MLSDCIILSKFYSKNQTNFQVIWICKVQYFMYQKYNTIVDCNILVQVIGIVTESILMSILIAYYTFQYYSLVQHYNFEWIKV